MHRPSERARKVLAPSWSKGRLRATAARAAAASSPAAAGGSRTRARKAGTPGISLLPRCSADKDPHRRRELAGPIPAGPEHRPVGPAHVVHAHDAVVAAALADVDPAGPIDTDAAGGVELPRRGLGADRPDGGPVR